MRRQRLITLALAGAVLAGCAANDLKAQKEDSWSRVAQALPDGRHIHNPALPTLSQLPDPQWVGFDPVPSAYGHVLRPFAFFLYPVGTALDYALMRPLYMLGGLAPEWFGLTADDALGYYSHMPELIISKDAPRHRYE
jgi:hypothetical protein